MDSPLKKPEQGSVNHLPKCCGLGQRNPWTKWGQLHNRQTSPIVSDLSKASETASVWEYLTFIEVNMSGQRPGKVTDLPNKRPDIVSIGNRRQTGDGPKHKATNLKLADARKTHTVPAFPPRHMWHFSTSLRQCHCSVSCIMSLSDCLPQTHQTTIFFLSFLSLSVLSNSAWKKVMPYWEPAETGNNQSRRKPDFPRWYPNI